MLNKRSAAMSFVFVTVLLDMVALGIGIPVWPKLILGFTGNNFSSAALVGGAFATIFAVMQFVVSPILGVFSDRVGRRPVILLSNLGTSIDYLIMALAPNLWWLFAGRVLAGITTSSITVASAYVSDVTPPDKRAGAYGLISGAFGVGFVVGPAIGGLLGVHDPRLPFWVAAGLSLVNFLYGLLVLPESLSDEHRNTFSWQRANPLGSVKMLRRHRELAGLSAVNFIGYIAHEALPQLFVYYAIYAFAWTTGMVGVSLAIVGVITVIISTMVIQPVVNRFGDRRAVIGGLFCAALGYLFYAGPQVLFWIGIPINMLWMLASSSSQALMTRRVDKNEQGELQGAIGMLRSVAMLIGPGLFTGVFAYSISAHHTWKSPGAAWIMGALMLFGAMVLAWAVTSTKDDTRDRLDTVEALETALPAEVPAVE